MEWLWISGRQSSNPKTGPIPTAYPADAEAAWQSCQGCPLRTGKRTFHRDVHRPQCYYWYGQGSLMLGRMRQAQARGRNYSLTHALKNRFPFVKAVRMSAGGDPSSTDPDRYFALEAEVRAAGLSWIDYTHFWRRKGAWLRRHAMASCDTVAEAHAAIRAGWRAAVHVPAIDAPHGTLDGVRYVLCPAQRPERYRNCNDCRLCDATRSTVPLIVFLNH